jgi:23S rRNA (adenine1618-N6)-methyltransferase
MGRSNVNSGSLHLRNPHGGRYDFAALSRSCPELTQYLQPNPMGDQTIDFSDSKSVLSLNQALLVHFYRVHQWKIPQGYLCPPIPGRADAIHYLADLLATSNNGEKSTGKSVKVLDVGTGANCIYPIIGSQSYGWKFVGTDIDPVAIKTARAIVAANPCLLNLVKIRQQKDPTSIFRGIIGNPPFHASMEDAQAGSLRKLKNLGKVKVRASFASSNFGGQHNELWCPGGEVQFVTRMIEESVLFSNQVGWFTSLVSKSENLRPLKTALAQTKAKQVKIIHMSQGQKRSRLLAWNFQM